jgi:hypothetical protein
MERQNEPISFPRVPEIALLRQFNDIEMQILMNRRLKEDIDPSERKRIKARFKYRWRYDEQVEKFMKFLQWKQDGEPETHDPVLDTVVAKYLRWKNAREARIAERLATAYLAQYPIHQARHLLCKLAPEGTKWSTDLAAVDWLKEKDEGRIRSSFKERFGHLRRVDLDRLQNDLNYIPQGMVSVKHMGTTAIKRAEEEWQETKKGWRKLMRLSVAADHSVKVKSIRLRR